MQPYVITLPDSIRDALKANYRGPNRQYHAEESQRAQNRKILSTGASAKEWIGYDKMCGDIVAACLFNPHPSEEDRTFLQDFQERFLRMMDGSGHPVLLLKNLPPGTDRMVMDGLAQMSARTVDHRFVFPMENSTPQPMHRDSQFNRNHHKKSLQFVYCRTAGKHQQPTNFVSADEALAQLAKTTGEPVDSLAQQLMDTTVHHITRPSHPFLIKNPHPDPVEGAVNYIDLGDAPGQWPHQRSKNAALIKAYHAAADACAMAQNDSAVGSTEPHTLLMWNEHMVLHGRGRAHGKQRGRELLLDKTYPDAAPAPSSINNTIAADTPFGHLARGPISYVERTIAPTERNVGPDGVVRRR
jgi:hypothetical protein